MSRKRSTREASSPALDALDAAGWIAVPDVLSPGEAHALAEECASALAEIDDDVRVGDKQGSGTRRLVELVERVPTVATVVEHLSVVAAVGWFLGESARLGNVTFRSPRPGFGEQRLHIDHLPLERPGKWRVVTAIVALCDFRSDNGATAVVPGSHRRPDLSGAPIASPGATPRWCSPPPLGPPSSSAGTFCTGEPETVPASTVLRSRPSGMWVRPR